MSEADEQQYIDDDGLTLGSGSGKCRDILDDLGDLSDLPDGIYFLHLMKNGETTVFQKIVKVH